MNFNIDPREGEALLRAIESYLPELERSLSRIEHRPRERHELAVDDELLIGIRNRLRVALERDPVGS